ncbi:MAG: DUF1846 family protein, partial [Lachnospiraceae bacterium]|nr:DUF1846 family protein [Lachnospiraceae bacterium]
MAGHCIIDDEVVQAAASQEIIRRFYQTQCDRRKGDATDAMVQKTDILMQKAGLSIADRPVVKAANIRAEESGGPASAIEMPDGAILSAKTSSLLGASSAMIFDALKYLAGIDDSVKLLSPEIIEPIMELKVNYLGNHNPLLHIDEILIAMSIEAITNPVAKAAYAKLPELRGLEVHSSVILSQVDIGVFKKLGINLTCEPKYENKKFFHM